jgi:hypothetical protein
MSSLLERAIVDATALKEAALKNAENLVIEKYSAEVKDAVSRLLEQDEDAFADDLGAEAEGLGDFDLDTDTAEEETTDDAETEAAKEFADSTIGDIPDAFDPDLGDPDDEIINIKLDSLRAELPEEEEGVFGGDDELTDDEIGIDITDEDEIDDEIDLDIEDDVDFDVDTTDFDVDATDTAADTDIGIDISPEMVAEVLAELDLDEEYDLEDLEEAVRVDFEPQKSGWAGTPESIMQEYEAMLLAREQDSKVKEENEELRKTVAALQQENKTIGSIASKLEAKIEKYSATLETLQEKLETTNVSNAKLLYINRALENASLNERQKETKIVFDTLQETVTSSPAEKRVDSLNEAVSRRSTLLVAAHKEQEKGSVNPAFNRLQRLAGIK